MTEQQKNYFQQVKASGRTFGFLGLMLGITAGALTGVAVKGLVDEPIVTGGGALAFYAAFGASSLLTMFVMLNYLTMSLRVADDKLDIRLGMKSAIVSLDEIVEVRIAQPQSRMTRAAAQTRPDRRSISKLWSVLGVKTGIEIDISRSGSANETWFIASNDPESLSEHLAVATSSKPSDSGDQADSQPKSD